MSISSSFYAQYAEREKKDWLNKLKEAREEKDWELIDALIKEMDEFHFEE